jgi:hypothetical protein
MKAPDVTVIVEDERWKKARPQVKRAALAAYVRVNADAVRPFTILLTTDRKLRTLNANFRGKDKPTNVLSFPIIWATSRLRMASPRAKPRRRENRSPIMPRTSPSMAYCIFWVSITNVRAMPG